MSLTHVPAAGTCRLAVTLLLIACSAGAQTGDQNARALLERAIAALQANSDTGRAEAERLLHEALNTPAQTPESQAEIGTVFALYLTGKGAPPLAVRQVAEQVMTYQRQATRPVDPGKQALPLEIMIANASPESSPEELQDLQRRALALRVQSLQALRAGEGPAEDMPKQVFQIGSGVTVPSPIYKPEPTYSEYARLAKKQGAALFSIVIDPQGVPRNLKLVRSLGFGLDEEAYRAMRQWRFKPATKDGEAVAVSANVEINFRLL